MRISKGHLLALVRSALEQIPAELRPGRDRVPSLTEDERQQLLRWMRGGHTPRRIAIRTAIALLATAGWNDSRIAASVGVTRRTVAMWRTRCADAGVRALLVDAPGRGRKPGRNGAAVERILTMSTEPPLDGSRWTVRSLARAVGVSHATVQRVWKENPERLPTAASSGP